MIKIISLFVLLQIISISNSNRSIVYQAESFAEENHNFYAIDRAQEEEEDEENCEEEIA